MYDAFPTIQHPLAIIGIAEKGYLSIEYRISIPPGHSSIPTNPSAIGILASAVDKLENIPHPSKLGYGPEKDLLLGVAPYLKFPFRVILTNMWLFGPIIQWILSLKPGTNSLQRTTTAITLFNGGEKENTLPTTASMTVNR